jgi:hypothetical protein
MAFATETSPLLLLFETGAPRCIEAPALRNGLTQRLGYDPFFADPILRVVVDLGGTSTDLEARVSVYNPMHDLVGERRLQASDCSLLVERLMLVLSLAIEAGNDEVLAAVAAPPPAAISSTLPSARPPPPSSGVAVNLGVALSGGFGLVPGFAVATTIEAELRRRWLSVGLEGTFVFPTTWTTSQNGSYSEQLYLGSVVPCAVWGPLAGCAVATAGAVHVKGTGYSDAQASVTPYFSLGARGLANWSLSDRWILRGQIGFEVPIVKPTIELGEVALWTQPAVTIALGVAVLIRLD